MLLHLQKVVAEVQDVKSPLLSQEHDDHAARPVEAVPEALPAEQRGRVGSRRRDLKGADVLLRYSLHGELVRSHGDAVHELHGTPEAVELHTLVHVHHAVARQRPAPDWVIQEGAHSGQDDLKHGQAAAQPLFGQQVTLPCDGDLLMEADKMRSGARRLVSGSAAEC